MDAETVSRDAIHHLVDGGGLMIIYDVSYKNLLCAGPSPAPRIIVCYGEPPQEPNMWTDGSYRIPSRKLSIGTLGVWQLDRDLAELETEETDFALPVWPTIGQTPRGIVLAGVLPGVFNSSARTESLPLSAVQLPVASPYRSGKLRRPFQSSSHLE